MRGAALVLILASAVWIPQELANEEQYREKMREIDHSFEVLRKNRHLRHGPEIEKEARALSELFEKVEAFWKGRGDEEAAGFARMAAEGADEAAKAATKKEQKALDAAVATIAASCEGCHQEPLDKYRFK